MGRRDRVILPAAGLVLVAALAAIGSLPAPHARVPVFLSLYAVAFAAYAAAAVLVLRARADGRAALALILAVAVLGRAVLLPSNPDLSTDIYRYAWEGRVILDGANPFAVAPGDTTLAHLRDADYEFVSHKHMATIYPPLAQGIFAACAAIHPGVFPLKVAFSLFDLATVLLVMGLLRRRGRPRTHALVYAWSPLVMVETAHSGHLDAAGIFLLVAGLSLWESGRRAWAGAVMGLSFLVKYLAAAVAPHAARRRAWGALAAAAVVAVIGYAPFLGAGAKLLDSLRAYTETWSFNGPPFLALSGFLGDPVLARRLLAGFGVTFAVVAAFRERDLPRYAYLVIGCGLLVTPTVYPWYVAWIVPFLCFFVNPAWILFTGLVALSYVVWIAYADSGAWMLPAWLMAAEYLPFYALLLWGLARAPRAAERAP